MKIENLVPDTSVIIEGVLSKKIEEKEIKPDTITIHEAVVSELEHQANQNREEGYLGLDELKKLRELSQKYEFQIKFSGKKPTSSEIKYASFGEIDSQIRELAYEQGATLFTADKIQAKVAEAKGINIIFHELKTEVKKIELEKFFDETTMSIHLREEMPAHAKKGVPGNWEYVQVTEEKLTRDDLIRIAKQITEEAKKRKDTFIEIEREGSTIVQLANYRIVIVKTPFADGWEITAVRPVKKLNLEDYNLSEKLRMRVGEQAEGILIAGAPGHGKSTIAQALAEYYANKNKVVKTVEAPRDLQLPDSITQYAISRGSPQEIHDILLLSRPDYTIFDEMRNTEDFKLFADMRLSGVGMIGVVHATNPIDAIQRFIGRIELGVIPQIIDTVLFIRNGGIDKALEVRMQVKVPSGMTEADLARPVVTVTDFETGKLEFEIYSYGEETVVVPVQEFKIDAKTESAVKSVQKELERYANVVKVEPISANKVRAYVSENAIGNIIGKKGANIDKIEKKTGMSIDIEPLQEMQLIQENEPSNETREQIQFSYKISSHTINIMLEKNYANSEVEIFVNDEYLMNAKVSKKAIIKIQKGTSIGKILVNAINSKEKIDIFSI
jgi:ATPase